MLCLKIHEQFEGHFHSRKQYLACYVVAAIDDGWQGEGRQQIGCVVAQHMGKELCTSMAAIQRRVVKCVSSSYRLASPTKTRHAMTVYFCLLSEYSRTECLRLKFDCSPVLALHWLEAVAKVNTFQLFSPPSPS
jgi:hypothetical protein